MYQPFVFKERLKVRLGKRVLSIRQLPAYRQLELIHYVAYHFDKLSKLHSQNLASGYASYYMSCVKAVWELIKYSSSWWERWRVKRIFHKQAIEDIGFLFDIINEIYNHWQFMGKWLPLLAEGRSLQMRYGTGSTEYYMDKGLAKRKSGLSLLKKLISG